ncbi:MAG: type IV pilus twitching motility protein PilT [Planctomycetes bacterium]|nr:type IV pilus twitching motility protein PilT [Planctomycetota bacterium]
MLEHLLSDGPYLTRRQFEQCKDFLRVGSQEGLEIEQVCHILAGEGFLSSATVREVLSRVRPAGLDTSAASAGPWTSSQAGQAREANRESPTKAPVSPVAAAATERQAFPERTGASGRVLPPPPPIPDQPYLLTLLAHARSVGASDLHLSAGLPPTLRLHGRLVPLALLAVTAEQSLAWVSEILPSSDLDRLQRDRELDFACSPAPGDRYRANAFWDRHGIAASFRVIAGRVPTLDDLGLPAVLAKLTEFRQGLVLITGPAGSGKSTTLAALLGRINRSRKEHIITIEDPIEFIHPSDLALVNQRQVGPHTHSFATALRSALRENPDIIMVGEMRDLETISMAISAAETGHLVFGTLHTRGATRTIDRILDVFPPKEQPQVRAMVAESLRAVVSQLLLPNSNGLGRSLATEILMMNPAAANLIREGRTFQLRSLIQTGKRLGMRLMDDSLLELVEAGKVSADEAVPRAENASLFAPLLRS